MLGILICLHSLMDKTQLCGSCDRGSIPRGGIISRFLPVPQELSGEASFGVGQLFSVTQLLE